MSRRIIEELEALASHYIRPVRSAAEHERFLADYLTDLKAYPMDAIEKACKDWRRSEATKFPTCGQLLAFVRSAMPKQEVYGQLWAPLAADDYEKLTMAEKVRYLTTLAMDAATKAGPMWVNGRPAEPDELPEKWHKWTAISKEHFAEAKRLREKLMEAKGFARA
jgi:hypothetical protein